MSLVVAESATRGGKEVVGVGWLVIGRIAEAVFSPTTNHPSPTTFITYPSLRPLPTRSVSVFEQLRRSLNELLERAVKPEDRRLVVMRMKGTLVQARLGLDDVRDALAQSRRKLDSERRELETVRRRKELALRVQDTETVAIAERFERQHDERARVLEDKILVQTREVELAEREVEEMKAEIRVALAGGASPGGAPLEDSLDDDPLEDAANARARDELNALARERTRADRDADATRRLEELKRKMGQ